MNIHSPIKCKIRFLNFILNNGSLNKFFLDVDFEICLFENTYIVKKWKPEYHKYLNDYIKNKYGSIMYNFILCNKYNGRLYKIPKYVLYMIFNYMMLHTIKDVLFY